MPRTKEPIKERSARRNVAIRRDLHLAYYIQAGREDVSIQERVEAALEREGRRLGFYPPPDA